MNEYDTRFLLNAVPVEIVGSYLQRTFGWQDTEKSTSPRTLYIRYFSEPAPEICHSLADTFPDSCHLIQADPQNSIFLVSAAPMTFSRFLIFLTSADDILLLPEIEHLLEADTSAVFQIQNQRWRRDRPRVMGILNITPDSFSDGGRFYQKDDYTEIGRQMIEAGADIIDIGGESSRPGATTVDANEELQRVLKVVSQIRGHFHIPLSIDTVKPAVADAALGAGADMVNDISGLASGMEMLRTVQRHKASYCLMHTQGTPETMQQNPRYSDVIGDVFEFFQSGLKKCREAGLEKDRILLDPGIGFGKTVLNNIDILRLLPAFSRLGCLMLLGTSNKSFIGHTLNREIEQRTPATMTTQALGWTHGATVFRVHDIETTRDTLDMAQWYTREVEPA